VKRISGLSRTTRLVCRVGTSDLEILEKSLSAPDTRFTAGPQPHTAESGRSKISSLHLECFSMGANDATLLS
jgi:hypothetical protein